MARTNDHKHRHHVYVCVTYDDFVDTLAGFLVPFHHASGEHCVASLHSVIAGQSIVGYLGVYLAPLQ